jgi:hypothetical protein
LGEDLFNHPLDTVAGALTFKARMNEDTLHRATKEVFTTFKEYIPSHAEGLSTFSEAVFNLQEGVSGSYNRRSNVVTIRAYNRQGYGYHAAIHEFCHAYTSPAFYEALAFTPDEGLMLEAMTEHIADKIPVYGPLSRMISGSDSGYDKAILPDGGNWVDAAKRLENMVGKATLLRAFFGGDAAAISSVSRASVGIFPRRITVATEAAVKAHKNDKYSNCLSECLMGLKLLEDPRRVQSTMDPHQKHCMSEVRRVRGKLGEARFDQAFYNFDHAAAKEALETIRDELLEIWRPFVRGA